MVGNGEILNYNQKAREINSLSYFVLVNSHGGQKEAVLKYFIEIQVQTIRYDNLHVKFANFENL